MRAAAPLSIFLTLLVGIIAVSLGVSIDSEDDTRESKMFPFLAVINFNNGMPCNGTGSSGPGVCMKEKYCKQRSGVNIGSCSSGMGICCAITAKCSTDEKTITIKTNGTRIVKPDDMNVQSCRVVISKPKGVYGIKLDFVEFMLSDADDNGDCNNDDLVTIFESGTLGKPFTICGRQTGQHMYLAFSDDSEVIRMNFMTRTMSMYNVKVTYISSTSPKRVPKQCLQYFTDETGQVQSFGWPGQQQNNQDYTVCVDTGSTRDLTWRPCSDSSFMVAGGIPHNAFLNCDNQDYIQFVGSPNRICKQFPTSSPDNKSQMPNMMFVHFDDSELPYKIDTIVKDKESCLALSTDCVNCNQDPPTGDFKTCQCEYMEDVIGCKRKPHDSENKGFCLKYS